MSGPPNIVIAGLIFLGLAAALCGYWMDSKSSFDDGSFLIQMILVVAGVFFIAVGIVAKFALSFF